MYCPEFTWSVEDERRTHEEVRGHQRLKNGNNNGENVCGAYVVMRMCIQNNINCDLKGFPFDELWTSPWQLRDFINRYTDYESTQETFSKGQFEAYVEMIKAEIDKGNPCIILIDWGLLKYHYVNVVGYKEDCLLI